MPLEITQVRRLRESQEAQGQRGQRPVGRLAAGSLGQPGQCE